MNTRIPGLNWLVQRIRSAVRGGIIIYDANEHPSILAVGAASELLLSDGTDPAWIGQHVHTSAAKAWVNGSYGGGTPAADDSYNIASLDDNAVGDVGVNFTTAFADADYVAICQSVVGGTANESDGAHGYSFAAGAVEVSFAEPGIGLQDVDFVVVCFGGQ